MAAPVCELCKATSFIKEDGMFVCQSCGTKYTTEEAQKLMRANAEATNAAPISTEGPGVGDTPLEHPSDIRTEDIPSNGSARELNNSVCQSFQLLMEDYRRLNHPGKEQHNDLAARARECVAVLDSAAQLDPNAHEVDLLVMKNCKEIESAVQRASYYDQDEEGKWHPHTDPFCKVEISGQKDSWADKAAYHRDFLEQQFVDLHTLDWQRRLDLQRQVDALEADLADLKDEKRSKGFFNFAEKREVKDRMKPVKEEISGLQRQIRDIDRMVDEFVEDRLEALGQTYTRLDF